MKKCLKELQDRDNDGDKENDNSQGNNTPTTRTLPSIQRIHGVVPQPMQFGVSLPFKTPRKIQKVIEKQGNESDSLSEMYDNCTGRLVQVVDNTKKQRCEICKKTTPYYCAGCKSWFCFASCLTDKKKANSDDLNITYHCVKGKNEFFFNSCYAIKHQGAWKKQDEKTSATITTIQQSSRP